MIEPRTVPGLAREEDRLRRLLRAGASREAEKALRARLREVKAALEAARRAEAAARWESADDPHALLRAASHAWSRPLDDRKSRLLACGCGRLLEPLLVDPRSRAVLEVAERFADGGADEAELRAAGRAAYQAGKDRYYDLLKPAGMYDDAAYAAARAVVAAAAKRGRSCLHVVSFDRDCGPLSRPGVLAGLVRDVFGNPFAPAKFDPGWRTAEAASLAAAMYGGRTFAAMPALAAALERAGCDDEAVLRHCREQGSLHVRGCWVIDLVLGKA